MRVITGAAKGRKLIAPKGMDTRPTSAMMKETLFNVLQPLLADASFLDLYSGSGAIGIEALSRGAARSVFVENDPSALDCIQKNIQHTGFEDKTSVLSTDVGKALKNLFDQNQKFDIIFMDPPYGRKLPGKLLDAIASVLQEDGVFIAEIDAKASLPPCEALAITKEKRTKTTAFVFMEMRGRS